MIFISLPNAARQLGCAVKTVRRMIADGTIHAVKIGRRNKINQLTLLQLMQQTGTVN